MDTVPPSLAETITVNWGISSNIAVTVAFELTETVTELLDSSIPSQPVKENPSFGVAIISI